MPPDRIETLADAIRWIIDHDARIKVFWKNQHKLNDRVEKRMKSLENRVLLWTGAAAAIGSMLGMFGVFVLQRLIG